MGCRHIMDSQSSCVSAVSAASSVAEECGLNLEDPDLLTALEETEAEYFLDWFDQLEEPEEMETDQPNEEEEEVAGLPEATAAEFPSLSGKDAILIQQGRCCTKRCVTRFDEQEVIENRLTFVEMDTEVRNRYILFYIQSCAQTTRTHTETVPSKGHASKERERELTHGFTSMGLRCARSSSFSCMPSQRTYCVSLVNTMTYHQWLLVSQRVMGTIRGSLQTLYPWRVSRMPASLLWHMPTSTAFLCQAACQL